MKKIIFAITSTFIIVFMVAIVVFAAEVKTTLPAATNVPAAPAATAAPGATPAQIQQPPPPASTSDNYSYNPSGKPDPFKPFIVVVDVAAKQKAAKKAETSIFPLQRAEAESYRVVGIAGNKNHRIAIVEDAAQKFYPLFIGTHIGVYEGKVIEILADRVIVEEYEDKKARRIILKLRKN
jgi:type IV pilus assembly protein PilP